MAGESLQHRIVASAVVPGLFAPGMQPDAVWAAKPIPAVHDPKLTAAVIAAAVRVAAQDIGEWAGVGRIDPLRPVGIVGIVGIRKLPADSMD
jgi:hypothetical protein